jgi:hypothetical protein
VGFAKHANFFSKLKSRYTKTRSVTDKLSKLQQKIFLQETPVNIILCLIIYPNHNLYSCNNSKSRQREGLCNYASFLKSFAHVVNQTATTFDPHHLLWGLFLLKPYNIESVNAVLVGVTEKAFRNWLLMYFHFIANFPVVTMFFKCLYIPRSN